jgi:hypothetical protein
VIETRIEWHGEDRAGEIRLVALASIQRATLYLWERCVEVLNVPNTGERVKGRGRTPSGRRRTTTVYPHPSRPGEPPRKRTGFGQRSVKWEVDRDGVGRVGVATNAAYLAYLEVGTVRVKPRPWLLATVKKHWETLRGIVLGEAA